MKSIIQHARLALAASAMLFLAACGGGGGGGLLGGYTALPVQGTISGLNNPGLVLLNNGGDPIAPAAKATTFSFPKQVEIGQDFTVSIGTQPAHQTCTISNPSDRSGRTVSINVFVTCLQNAYTLGGTISGLTGAGLVLTNGGDQVTVAAGATSFVFPNKVADQAVYGVAVLTQPAGQACRVVNGTAVMGSSNVTSVQVICQ